MKGKTMKTQHIQIGMIPAILYGEPAQRGYLFLHGQMGHKEEAAAFALIACPKGYQVLSIDLPGHGERQNRDEVFTPWTAVPDIQAALYWSKQHWKTVSLRANSIGAYLAMLALDTPRRALLVSPIVDMERLILTMMGWAGVSEEQLKEQGENRHLFWPNPILDVSMLGTGASSPPLGLPYLHSLRKWGQYDSPSYCGRVYSSTQC